jgi:hypothetical protein
MDYLETQIKFHEGLIQIHTSQLSYLKNLQLHNKSDDLTTDDFPQENYLSNDAMLEKDQDIIWGRVRNAHTKIYGSDESGCCETQPEKKPVHKENNLNVPDVNPIIEQTVEHTIKSDIKLPESEISTCNVVPLITRLSKFPQKKQRQIMLNIFTTAKTNIEKLAELDISIAENIDEQIQVEADRLLDTYLDNK